METATLPSEEGMVPIKSLLPINENRIDCVESYELEEYLPNSKEKIYNHTYLNSVGQG